MDNRQKILLTGGTGQLGKTLVKQIDYECFKIDILTRNESMDSTEHINYLNADLSQRESLNAVRSDYSTVVHCASNPKKAEEVDVKGTYNLIRQIKNHNIGNFLYISIVGVDKSDFPYYKSKLKTEEMVIHSGLPYTILRVTQFHDFVYDRILNPVNSNSKFLSIPIGLKFQSIDLVDLCEEVLPLIKNKTTNSTLEIGGPEILKISDIIETYQNVIGPENKIYRISTFNDFQKIFTTGINLCPDNKKGKIKWKDYLLKKSSFSQLM